MGDLVRALGRNDRHAIYTSYREALALGQEASEPLRAFLLKSDWSALRHRGEMRYLSGLVGLLHDVDETTCATVVRELIRRGCSATVEVRLRGILSVADEDYRQYGIDGIEVRESKQILVSEGVRGRVKKWLEVIPKDDLEKLERLYVLPWSNQAYLGNYMPSLFKIVLVWKAAGLLETQRTLYHEIGHHAGNHGFGWDLVQEEEAESYASRMLISARPVAGRVRRWIGPLRGAREDAS